MFKFVTRTKAECIEDICGIVNVTDGGSETCTEDPHHGLGEKYEEGGDDKDEDEDKKRQDKKDKKNYNDDKDKDEVNTKITKL